MSKSGMYGDEITLRAMANMFNAEIIVISNMGEVGRDIITPEDSIHYHTPVLGHFSKEQGCHSIVLQEMDISLFKNLTLFAVCTVLTNSESYSDIGKIYIDAFDICR